MMMRMVVTLDMRIDAVMKIRGESLVCAFFMTDDAIILRRTNERRP